MGLDESIGEVLREMRERSGLTQEALAFRADLHRTYVSILERGLKSPTVAVLARLGAAMGTSGSAILHKAETRSRKERAGSSLVSSATRGCRA